MAYGRDRPCSRPRPQPHSGQPAPAGGAARRALLQQGRRAGRIRAAASAHRFHRPTARRLRCRDRAARTRRRRRPRASRLQRPPPEDRRRGSGPTPRQPVRRVGSPRDSARGHPVTAPADTRLGARRAIEALRSGVPSRDAVAALGTGQAEIEDRFTALLDNAGSYRRERGRGLLLGGGFGAGKSHVLEHLAHLALDRGFAVSRVVISKETPLHDPAKVLRTAVETAAVDDATVSAVGEAAAGLDPGSTSFADLLRWSSGPGAPVDERFPLTLSLLARMQASDDEFVDTIVRFWSGD